MNAWKLYQYGNIVNSFLNTCDSDMIDAIEEALDLLSEKGNMCTMPLSEPLGDGLFALRIKENRNQARLMYFFGVNRQVFFVNAFFKTTQKIPHGEIDLSKKRKTKILKGEINFYVIN